MSVEWKGKYSKFEISNVQLVSVVCSTVHSIQGKTIPATVSVVLTDFRRYWNSFPSAGFYVALTRPVEEDQLIVLGEPFTLAKLQKLAPSHEAMVEYSRLWRLFEKSYTGSDLCVPLRTDGPKRMRLI